MRGRQTVRQWKILRFLASSKNGKTVSEIFSHIGRDAHVRTIYRDLEVLQEAGFPIYDYQSDKINNQKKWAMLEGGLK